MANPALQQAMLLSFQISREIIFGEETDASSYEADSDETNVVVTRKPKRKLDVKLSSWWGFLEQCDGKDDGSVEGKLFRRRFGVQLSLLRDLTKEAVHHKLLTIKAKDACGRCRSSSPRLALITFAQGSSPAAAQDFGSFAGAH